MLNREIEDHENESDLCCHLYCYNLAEFIAYTMHIHFQEVSQQSGYTFPCITDHEIQMCFTQFGRFAD